MNLLFLAGGAFLGMIAPEPEVVTMNHTLRGELIPSNEVVCRNRWGTPMLPDGKGGYSLIAPINPEFISFSLVQPPKSPKPPTSQMAAFRPSVSVVLP